jgi:predicted PurR-regulated permease PerM
LITPNIERHTVRLPPGITISTQLILGVLIGGQGLILTTPLVAVVMVLVKILYVEDVLGEEITTPDDEWKNSNESGNLNAETQRR